MTSQTRRAGGDEGLAPGAKAQCDSEGEELIIHVVGTKSNKVAEDPTRRKVPFERTIAYVAEQLYPSHTSTPTPHDGWSTSKCDWGGEWCR